MGLSLLAVGCAEEKTSPVKLEAVQTSNLEAGSEITLEEATRWTTKFRKLHSQETQAMYFDQSVYNALLEQNGVDGIRIYNAINEDNKQVLVLAGATASGDVLGKVFDKGVFCPPNCSVGVLAGIEGSTSTVPASAGSEITMAEAVSWTAVYREQNPNRLRAEYFSKSVIEDLLTQNGCLGIRIYKAIDDDNQECLVLVGVNSTGDMTSGKVFDKGTSCPDKCAVSPLAE